MKIFGNHADRPFEVKVGGKRVGRYETLALAVHAGDGLRVSYSVLENGKQVFAHSVLA